MQKQKKIYSPIITNAIDKPKTKQNNLKISRLLLIALLLLPLAYPLSQISNAKAAALSYSSSTQKSADVMKYTKDVITNQPSDNAIASLVNTLASANVTDIAVSVPMDATQDYPAGVIPSPRTAEAFTQKWADTVHQKSLHIIWRGTFSGIEGIYNFPKLVGSSRFPAGTAASAAADGQSTWLGKIYQYIVSHPGYFAAGDIWAPLPERTEGIFQDSTSFLPSTGNLQTTYANFFNDLRTVSNNAFARIGKNVVTGASTNNYTEDMSGWLPQNLFDTAGAQVIDYYGNTHTPLEFDSDMRTMYAMHNNKPIFIQEWGDYWNVNLSQTDRTAYLNSIYAVLQKLVNDGIVVGFNYWGGWDNGAEGILSRSGDSFSLNYRGQLLAHFFGANVMSTLTTSATPAPLPTPTTTAAPAAASCPPAATNAFIGCYFTDQNLTNLGLVRTDNAINFDWGDTSPAPGIPANQFSVSWQGNFNFNAGTYTFAMTSDDGSRLYIDGQKVADQWRDQAATTYNLSQTLTAGVHTIKMEYYQAFGGDIAKLSWIQTGVSSSPTQTPTTTQVTQPATSTPPTTALTCPPAGINSFTGCYYSGQSFNTLLLTRNDSSINFNWGYGSPAAAIPVDHFSARWQGLFSFTAGSHTFNMASDDGARLYIDGQLAIDKWFDHNALTTYNFTKTLSAGLHNITMVYYEDTGSALATLNWQ